MKSSLRICFSIILISLNSFAQKDGGLSDGMAISKKYSADKKRNLYGFVNHNGKVEIPFEYDTVFRNFYKGLAIVGKGTKAGVIDKKNHIVVPFKFESIAEPNRNIIPVEDGRWGFYSRQGKMIIECAYDNFSIKDKDLIMVQKNGKWGIIDHKGNVKLDFNYRGLVYVSFKKYHCIKENNWTLRNHKNEIIKTLEFDSIRLASNDVYVYCLIGRYGILNKEGKVIIDPEYDRISDFKNGLAIVTKSNKEGVIDENGKSIISTIYKSVIVDSLYIRVKTENDRWGLFSREGNQLIKPKFISMSNFSNGLIAVKYESGGWGYVDPIGNVLILSRYTEAGPFSKVGLAQVKIPYSIIEKDVVAIINTKGNFVIKPKEYNHYQQGIIRIDRNQEPVYIVPREKYSEYKKLNSKYILVKLNGKAGVITTEGLELIPPLYDTILPPSPEGFFVVQNKDKSGIIGPDGKFTLRIPNKYEKIYAFHEGLAKFMLKGKFGFLDHMNNVYISPQYSQTGDFTDGALAIVIRGKWGFMNKDERLIVQPNYDEVKPFKNGVSVVRTGSKWNLVNKEGKELQIQDLEEITELNTGRYLLKNNGKVGLADKNGKEILAIKYDELEDLGNGYVKVKRYGMWGLMDYKENIIMPVENDIFIYYPPYNLFLTGKKGEQVEVRVK
jgi:hypothetical protein